MWWDAGGFPCAWVNLMVFGSRAEFNFIAPIFAISFVPFLYLCVFEYYLRPVDVLLFVDVVS